MQTSISPHHDDCLTAWQSLHLECVMNPKWWNKIWNRNSSPYNWISSTLSSKSVTYYIRMWNTLTVFVSLHSCVRVKGSGLVVRDPDSVLSAARKTLNANKSSYRFFLFFFHFGFQVHHARWRTAADPHGYTVYNHILGWENVIMLDEAKGPTPTAPAC